MNTETIAKIADEIMGFVDEKPAVIGNGILLDWVDRLTELAQPEKGSE